MAEKILEPDDLSKDVALEGLDWWRGGRQTGHTCDPPPHAITPLERGGGSGHERPPAPRIDMLAPGTYDPAFLAGFGWNTTAAWTALWIGRGLPFPMPPWEGGLVQL